MAFVFSIGCMLDATASQRTLLTEANVPIEITFQASGSYADPFNEVTLDVIFLDPYGREFPVPAFWAGTNIWKVRYSSPVPGVHRFRTWCSAGNDKGLNGLTGKVEVKPYQGKNPLYARGPLRVSANRRYLEHSDGRPFFWLGDTWWMGLCHRIHWPDEFKTLAADRKEKGFNVIQIVAGLYPDMHPFDPRGANETGYPWETNYTSIRPEYFNAADERLQYLVDEGFTVCLFGSWGHYIVSMGIEKTCQHWRYLIARYGAWPVVWCASGEANLPWYLVKDFPYDDRDQARDWTQVMHYIRGADPFHRLLTVHPTGIHRLSARNVIDDPALLDFDMLQTPHGMRKAVPDTVKNMRLSYEDAPVMPVINGEAAYEMLKGSKTSIPTEWTRRMFWLCMMNGAAGHTYGANGIWQCNRKEQPHGPSPPTNSPAYGYGTIPWDEAMNLPGSQQVGFGKKLLEQYPWQDFQPHPEWAEFVTKSTISLEGCQWIWFPEGEPATNAPAEKRFFRKTFVLPEGTVIQRAQLRISADDQFTARLNERLLGSASDYRVGKQFNELARWLKPGTNILAVQAENLPTTGDNPAGLIARMEMQFPGGQLMEVVTDGSWRCAKQEVEAWAGVCAEDSSWTNARVVGCHGDSPWKQLDSSSNEDVHGPQSTGIPGVVRMIYVPLADAVVVRELGAQAAYSGVCFDPVSGTKSPPFAVQADREGSWLCPPPPGQDHDWLLILEPKTNASR